MNARSLIAEHKTISCEAIADALSARGVTTSRSAVEHYLAGRRRLPLWFFNHVAEIVGMPADKVRLGQMLIRDELQTRDAEAPGGVS
jgi:hypothetical protein